MWVSADFNLDLDTLTNFDKHYSKVLKLFGTKNEDLAINYFQMLLRDFNLFSESSVNKYMALHNFVVGRHLKWSVVYA